MNVKCWLPGSRPTKRTLRLDKRQRNSRIVLSFAFESRMSQIIADIRVNIVNHSCQRLSISSISIRLSMQFPMSLLFFFISANLQSFPSRNSWTYQPLSMTTRSAGRQTYRPRLSEYILRWDHSSSHVKYLIAQLVWVAKRHTYRGIYNITINKTSEENPHVLAYYMLTKFLRIKETTPRQG